MKVPLLWLAVTCEDAGVPPALAERVWASFAASRWTRPTALRQWLVVQPYVDLVQFRRQVPPAVLLTALEDLVRERRLWRAHASALEEYLLGTVQANGHWRGDPAPPAAWRGCTAPDVSTLAGCGKPP
jgi:hypothetical protein